MSEKHYMKMADVFNLPVKDEDRESAVELFSRMVSAPYSVDYTIALSQYAAHAINSHDELVAEVERLREFERDALRYRFLRDNCTTQQADSCGPIFVMTISQKNNLFNVGLSIDEAMNV